MKYEELILKKGKYVFLYLEPFNTWVKCKVLVIPTEIISEDLTVRKGLDSITLKGKVGKSEITVDINNPIDAFKYQIRETKIDVK